MGFDWIGANSFLGDGTSPIMGSIAESVHGMVDQMNTMAQAMPPGMDATRASVAGLPHQAVVQPPRPNRWDPHPDHFRQPRVGGMGRGNRGGNGGYGTPQPNPGAPPPGTDVDATNAALAQYGQRLPEPDEINPNAFLPNTGFFGRHQKFAAGLEGLMLGMANTAPSDTTGEGISNAIRGGLSPLAMRRQSVADQYDRPFKMAQQVADLQKDHDEHELKTAQANYYNDRGTADIDRINATRPYTDPNGNVQTYDPGSKTWKQQDSPDQQLYKEFRDEQMHKWLRDPKNEGKPWGAEQEVQARGEFMKQMNTGLVKEGMRDQSAQATAKIRKGPGGNGSTKTQLKEENDRLAKEVADAESDYDAYFKLSKNSERTAMQDRFGVHSDAEFHKVMRERIAKAKQTLADFVANQKIVRPPNPGGNPSPFPAPTASKRLDVKSLVAALVGDK